MITKEFVEDIVSDLKKSANKAYENNKYDEALSLVSICAAILYQTNIYYRDNDLEDLVEKLAGSVCNRPNNYQKNEDVCLFWDGFGLNDRGLAQIYLKALSRTKKIVYVTYEDRKNQIPDLKSILEKEGNKHLFIDRKKSSYSKQIKQLEKIIEEYMPSSFFFYSVPDDVVAIPIMYSYEGSLKRVQINLTDHSFWLGAGCIDTCVEFREYGASISIGYRQIESNKIRIVPFYPMLHEERKFLGFPFEVKEGQKIVFSGGALYKTLGANNLYYKVVDRLLEENKSVIFWYAGSGDDSEMKKLIKKYPGRAYLTAERLDLFQVLKHSAFYLSTYPLCGGLMYQYAAKAGKVPVTLVCNEVTDGFLLNQKQLNIEFNNVDEMFVEIEKLLNDSSYVKKRENEMVNAVISEESFNIKVAKIFSDDKPNISYSYIDTTSFRQWYLDTLTKQDVERALIRKNAVGVGIKYYPGRFLRGGYAYSAENIYDVSVIVATYNPVYEKMMLTIDSIICQKGVNIELIMTDDGSKNNYFGEIKEHLRKKGFINFELIEHKENQGTVLNVYDGVIKSGCKFVKIISPGDILESEDVLYEWIQQMIYKDYGWSFSDAVYYCKGKDKYVAVESKTHPQIVEPYLKEENDVCRWNYVVNDDIAMGATLLCTRPLFEEYLLRIIYKVKYAEDNVWRLMMHDGIVPYYHPVETVIYECNTGVSTSGDDCWSKLLSADWATANKIMFENPNEEDNLQKEMRKYVFREYSNNRILRKIEKLLIPGRFRISIKRKIHPRLSNRKYIFKQLENNK